MQTTNEQLGANKEIVKKTVESGLSESLFAMKMNPSVTARSRSGLWLQTTEDRERSRRQSEIPQILF